MKDFGKITSEKQQKPQRLQSASALEARGFDEVVAERFIFGKLNFPYALLLFVLLSFACCCCRCHRLAFCLTGIQLRSSSWHECVAVLLCKATKRDGTPCTDRKQRVK